MSEDRHRLAVAEGRAVVDRLDELAERRRARAAGEIVEVRREPRPVPCLPAPSARELREQYAAWASWARPGEPMPWEGRPLVEGEPDALEGPPRALAVDFDPLLMGDAWEGGEPDAWDHLPGVVTSRKLH